MSRNRVKNTQSLHWAAVLQWIAGVLILVLLAASYVALKNRVLRLASEVHQQEIELNNWKKRNQQIQYNIARVTSFQELQHRLTTLGSGMVRISELEVHPMEDLRMEGTAIARGNTTAGASP